MNLSKNVITCSSIHAFFFNVNYNNLVPYIVIFNGAMLHNFIINSGIIKYPIVNFYAANNSYKELFKKINQKIFNKT